MTKSGAGIVPLQLPAGIAQTETSKEASWGACAARSPSTDYLSLSTTNELPLPSRATACAGWLVYFFFSRPFPLSTSTSTAIASPHRQQVPVLVLLLLLLLSVLLLELVLVMGCVRCVRGRPA